jgi:hypothetical protein
MAGVLLAMMRISPALRVNVNRGCFKAVVRGCAAAVKPTGILGLPCVNGYEMTIYLLIGLRIHALLDREYYLR